MPTPAGVPVEMMCCHEKRFTIVASMTMPEGETGLAVDAASAVDNVIQSLVTVSPVFSVTDTDHWISSVVNVPAGTVTFCAVPQAMVLIVPELPARQRKVVDVAFTSSRHSPEIASPHEKTFVLPFGTYPLAGDIPVGVTVTSSSRYDTTI